jgi:hypothetical protein
MWETECFTPIREAASGCDGAVGIAAVKVGSAMGKAVSLVLKPRTGSACSEWQRTPGTKARSENNPWICLRRTVTKNKGQSRARRPEHHDLASRCFRVEARA